MKPFIINKNSWHYRLATWFDRGTLKPTDFCSYARLVFLAIVMVAVSVFLLLALCATILIPAGGFAIWVFQYFTSATPVPLSGPGIAFLIYLMIACVVAILCAVHWVINAIKRRRQNARARQILDGKDQSGFVRTWWRTFRGKFCIPIKFENKK